MDAIQIFDTTLRDGEQSPGASMSLAQKFEIAQQLEHLGVNVIEAGFPVSSPHQFKACQMIAEKIQKVTIAALSRPLEKDIEAAAESLHKAAYPRIHIFAGTSPTHMQFKLKKTPKEVLQMIEYGIKAARNRVAEVEFSPEDATRTEMDFLCEVAETAIKAGATIINIPDTVGYTVPSEYSAIIQTLKERVPSIDKIVLSTHCHDDLGLAVANTLSAIEAGARQVEVTINGIGERAGNAALEEVVMALYVRKDALQYTTTIKHQSLYATSRLVSAIVGFPIARNKAIVGENAFSHEAGIHQDGVLKHRKTYEIMTPESVGREASKFVLGRHSGIHGFRHRLSQLQIVMSEEDLKEAFSQFIHIADQKKEVYDEDIIAIVSNKLDSKTALYKLEGLSVHTGVNITPTAKVEIRTEKGILEGESTGDGPISAVFNAINQTIEMKVTLLEYDVQAITPGNMSVGEVSVLIAIDRKRSIGRGSSTDIIEASAIAYLTAISHNALLLEVPHP